MRFLIDACLPRHFAAELAGHGFEALDLRNLGMGRADDRDVAAYARAKGLCLLTEDWGFSDIRRYPPADYCGIVVFETSDNSVGGKIAALGNLLAHPDAMRSLPGRLAIVTASKIRLRPPL